MRSEEKGCSWREDITPPLLTPQYLYEEISLLGYYSLSIHLFLQVKYIMKSSTAHMFYIYTHAHPYGLNCFPPKFLCWEF